MDQPASKKKHQQGGRIGNGAFVGLAAVLVFLAYFLVFLLSSDDGLLDAAANSLRNLIPIVIISAATSRIVARHLVGHSVTRQLSGHVLLAGAYSLLLYWLLMVLIGIAQGDSFTEFVVKAFFPTSAVTWQLLQGLTFYGLVASLTHLRAQPVSRILTESTPIAALPRDQSPSRFFVRKGEDIHPIEMSEIVSIKGADDYADVATLGGRHLVRMTLAEFEKTLQGMNFIRVHRSHIVNVDRIDRAEPAGGGRMLLHMEDGEMISASRAGSRRIRERVI